MQTGPLMTRPSAPLGALELPCIVTVLALAGEAFVKQGKKQGKKVQWGRVRGGRDPGQKETCPPGKNINLQLQKLLQFVVQMRILNRLYDICIAESQGR